MIYQVTITVAVKDTESLHRAAAFAAGNHGLAPAEYEALRVEDDDPVATDLRMVLDPGISPDGTDIIETSSEYREGRDNGH